MIRHFFYLSSLFLILLTIQTNGQSKDTTIVTQILPGIIHKKIISEKDTMVANVLIADLKENNILLKSFKHENTLFSKETTSRMFEELIDSGYNVIAGINSDFFENDGDLINNMISDGVFIKGVKFSDSPFNDYANSQFCLTGDNKPFIEQFVFDGSVIFPNGVIEKISRINCRTDSNSFTIYNKHHGEYTPEKFKWNLLETILLPVSKKADTIIAVNTGIINREGKTKLDSDKMVLSYSGKNTRYLENLISKGDTVKLVYRMFPYYENIQTLVGGWGRLVKDGKNVTASLDSSEHTMPRFSKNRHPRTGIGLSQDSTKLFFIIVDGRQKSSKGMSLLEFADLMISNGIYQGLNLDGGGSTTMVINNEVVNNPSDITGERSVGNSLFLIRKTK
ncbi:MAG: phosphodiester glycosidase family protein [Ignavibacteriales bacterium]|nr:MAG: phosphodiester glycosidase family protein [Ignavibacteriales bacterium]